MAWRGLSPGPVCIPSATGAIESHRKRPHSCMNQSNYRLPRLVQHRRFAYSSLLAAPGRFSRENPWLSRALILLARLVTRRHNEPCWQKHRRKESNQTRAEGTARKKTVGEGWHAGRRCSRRTMNAHGGVHALIALRFCLTLN